MNFVKALEIMKTGEMVKLPSWGGYWYWDNEKKTIIMHTKDGEELDIRETEVPDYTAMNIASDEWIVANGENCPELGGEATFSFGEAIKYVKRGLKVARKGWNGKGHQLFFAVGEDLTSCISPGTFVCEPAICVAMEHGRVGIGWTPSQADMLADDWVFANEK